MNDKLLIMVDNGDRESGGFVRISDKANALLENVAKRSNRSKSYVASRMIEYAFAHIEYSDDTNP